MSEPQEFSGVQIVPNSPLAVWIEMNYPIVKTVSDGLRYSLLNEVSSLPGWLISDAGEASEGLEEPFDLFLCHGIRSINWWALAHGKYYLERQIDYSNPGATTVGLWIANNSIEWRELAHVVAKNDPAKAAKDLRLSFERRAEANCRKVNSLYGAFIMHRTSEIDWGAIASWIHGRINED